MPQPRGVAVIAILVLTKLWVNRMDTGDSISGYTKDRGRGHANDGEVRTYAGGRRRAIITAGESGKFKFTMVDLTQAEMETLREWKGTTVEVRDHRGQRFVGVYFQVDIGEAKVSTLYDVSIELETLSFEEGV